MNLVWDPDQTVAAEWTKTDDATDPVVIILPAFGAPVKFYRRLTPVLADAGISSLAVEYPGRDTRGGITRATVYGYDDLARKVVPAAIRQVREERGEVPIFLLGHSLGGQVSLFAAAAAQGTADEVDGVILAASASPFWRGYGQRGIGASLIGASSMALVSRTIGYWPGDVFKFWGRQSRVLVSEWARWARTGKLRFGAGSPDYMRLLREYSGDVLALSIVGDPLAPVSALERMVAMTPQAQVTRWHSEKNIGHINWVRDNATFVAQIVPWIKERARAQA